MVMKMDFLMLLYYCAAEGINVAWNAVNQDKKEVEVGVRGLIHRRIARAQSPCITHPPQGPNAFSFLFTPGSSTIRFNVAPLTALACFS